MCELTRLHCGICKSRNTFLFRFCKTISKDKHFGSIPPTGYRLHCPELIWPPQELADSHYVCDICLKKGVVWYSMAEQKAKLEQDALKAYRAKDPSRSGDVIELDDDSEDDSEDDSDDINDNEDDTHVCKVAGAFHAEWDDIHPLIKKLVVEKHRLTKRKEFDLYWESRLNDVPLRTLKLLVPFCKICKSASLGTEGGLEGVEMEPEVVLWKWMFKLQKETMIETNLSTDTMMKPCSRCANNELKLRQTICGFLKTCTNQQAWAVWGWLMMRGRGGVDFWHFKDIDTLGLPDCPPHEKHAYMRLMAEGWEDKAGSAWENFVDIDFSPTYTFPVIHCPGTLVELGQWNYFANLGIISTADAELALQPPAPPLLSEEPSNDENPDPDSMGDSIQPVQGDDTVPEIGPDGVIYKPLVSEKSSPTATGSDTTSAAHARDGFDSPTSKATYDALSKTTNKDTGTTESWDDLMQDNDDIFGDKVVGRYDNLAVQHPDETTHTDGRGSAAPGGDVEMGGAVSTGRDADFEQYKDGYWPYSGPAKPSGKRVHFE